MWFGKKFWLRARRPGWIRVSTALVFVVLGAIVGCGRQTGLPTGSASTATARDTAVQAASQTAQPPTPTTAPSPTPEPLALTVNGEPILLSDYEHELARCQAGKASAGFDPTDCPAKVVQQLTEQAVVEQAAAAVGLSVSEAEVDAALNKVTASLGGPGPFNDWLSANQYGSVEFRAALRADLLRARMVAQVTAAVPDTAEQVHAREILVLEAVTADTLLSQIKSGSDFATLALAYSRDLSSRAAGGDLGWFPRGLLTMPELEAAAFALQPGETSEVVHSSLGYHIVQVIERDPARPLSPAAAQAVRAAAWAEWLKAQLAQAVVVNTISP